MNKELTTGTLSVPDARGINVVCKEALRGQVNELQHRYFRTLAPDCEVKTEADRWYFRTIVWTVAGLLFPPLLVGTAFCLYKAKKCPDGKE